MAHRPLSTMEFRGGPLNGKWARKETRGRWATCRFGTGLMLPLYLADRVSHYTLQDEHSYDPVTGAQRRVYVWTEL
jgi:hypothetical protein